MKLAAFTVVKATTIDGYAITQWAIMVDGVPTADGVEALTELLAEDGEMNPITVPVTLESVIQTEAQSADKGLDSINFTAFENYQGTYLVLEDAADLPPQYTDISNIGNWDKEGPALVGTVENFRDWKCLQREIYTLAIAIAQLDWSTWDSLTEAQRTIVCTYLPGRVPIAKLLLAFPSEGPRRVMVRRISKLARQARELRITEAGIYLAANLTLANSAEIAKDLVNENLWVLYVQFGVESLAMHTQEGILDYFNSTASYAGGGLRYKPFTTLEPEIIDINGIADAVLDILDGRYS